MTQADFIIFGAVAGIAALAMFAWLCVEIGDYIAGQRMKWPDTEAPLL